MSVFKDEEDLKDFLKKQIEHLPNCEDVWIRKNLAKGRFYSQGRRLFTEDPSEDVFPLAQPEIDLVVRDMNDKLFGIEVKYLKFEINAIFPPRTDKSYYEGMGQALALLMFGFDCVSLWHCFDDSEGGDPGSIERYSEATRNLVTINNLPINYFVLRITRRRNVPEAVYLPLPRSQNKPWHELPSALPPLHGKENPFRSMPEVEKMRRFFEASLN